MARPRPAGTLAITLGVEEELFLVDPDSRDLLTDPDVGIFETCERTCGPHKVVREFLRSQIEINTRVCGSVAELREALRETRQIVIEAAGQYGAVPMAASTHPFASWQTQAITPKERYKRFAVTFQEGVRQFVTSGMHVHAGFGDADTRIRVMTALRRYLPLLHALSTSSPFNAGHETGFKSYRLSLIGGLAAHRHARPTAVVGRIRSTLVRVPAHEVHQRRQRVVVGHPTLACLSDGRASHLRRLLHELRTR